MSEILHFYVPFFLHLYSTINTSMELLEKILDNKNLYEAYKQVYKNKGTSGIDGITIEELGTYMYKHKEEIKEQIRNLKYKPSPVRRVLIPKENGKMRKLGIPTVVDGCYNEQKESPF